MSMAASDEVVQGPSCETLSHKHEFLDAPRRNTRGGRRSRRSRAPSFDRGRLLYWRLVAAPYGAAVRLLSDPVVAAVPAHECGEDLVDLRGVPELVLDLRKQDPDGAWARPRAGVLDRLLQAQRACPLAYVC